MTVNSDSEPYGAKIAGKYPTNLRKQLEKFHKKEYDEMKRKEKEKKEEEANKVSSFKKSKSPTSPSIELCFQGQKPYMPSSPVYQSFCTICCHEQFSY